MIKLKRPKRIKFKFKATEILYDKMMFYHTKAYEIYELLVDIIKNQKTARGDLLTSLHRDMVKFNEIAIECASKLAPYQSPKLESVEIKKNITHRFVVAAPKVISNTQQWLDSIEDTQKLNTIASLNTKQKINKNIQDIEIINTKVN